MIIMIIINLIINDNHNYPLLCLELTYYVQQCVLT